MEPFRSPLDSDGDELGAWGKGGKIDVSGLELWQLDDSGMIKTSRRDLPNQEYDRQLASLAGRP